MVTSRPSDYAGGELDEAAIKSPELGVVGWGRWLWRQLTSMRTALMLLLLFFQWQVILIQPIIMLRFHLSMPVTIMIV